MELIEVMGHVLTWRKCKSERWQCFEGPTFGKKELNEFLMYIRLKIGKC